MRKIVGPGAWTGTLKTLRYVYGVGSPTVGPTSSVRLHVYTPLHIYIWNIVACDVKETISLTLSAYAHLRAVTYKTEISLHVALKLVLTLLNYLLLGTNIGAIILSNDHSLCAPILWEPRGTLTGYRWLSRHVFTWILKSAPTFW